MENENLKSDGHPENNWQLQLQLTSVAKTYFI